MRLFLVLIILSFCLSAGTAIAEPNPDAETEEPIPRETSPTVVFYLDPSVNGDGSSPINPHIPPFPTAEELGNSFVEYFPFIYTGDRLDCTNHFDAASYTDTSDPLLHTLNLEFHWNCQPGTQFHRIDDYILPAIREKSCPELYEFSSEYPDNSVCILSESAVAESEQAGEPEDPCADVGNPINHALGNKYQIEKDYQSPSNGPLNFSRTYNSLDSVSSFSMGSNWVHSFEARIVAYANIALVYRPDGKVYSFTKQSNGSWEYSGNNSLKLMEYVDSQGNATGWSFIDKSDAVETYAADGRLTQIRFRAGEELSLIYDQLQRLESVTDSFGRALTFGYNGDGQVSSVTDPGGKVVEYYYDGQGNLERVEFPDGQVREYLYNEVAFMADGDNPHALTGIVDNGQRFATYAYDSQGRAISTEHSGGVEKYAIVYTTPGSAGNHSDAVVTQPMGGEVTYRFDVVNHALKLIATDTDCGTCGIATQSTEYDEMGFVEKRIDHNGVVTLYDHNARGLEDSRTEAANTPLARHIETDWHPEFHLPTEIREPGRLTEIDYDAVGNKESETITDTLTGESRTTSWTFYSYGKVATRNGPRTDVNDLTTYEYHPNWDLKKITNALGHETEITDYDAHGNPTRILDPNDVELLLEYDSRQRPKRYERNGEVTLLAYNNIGKLERVTFPTGGFLQYEYDDAQLLDYIEDSFGNRVDYSRDAGGNIEVINILDSGAALRYAQTRVHDVFSRLKEVITAGTDSVTYGYDPVGNLETVTEAGVFQTIQEFDALDRLYRVTDPGQGLTQYEYDQYGNLWKVTDAEGLVTEYKYNALGNLKELVSPDTGSTVYQYDAAGNQKQVTDARGVTTTFDYDALNRLISISYPDASENVTYLYDGTNYQAGELYGISRLTGMDDASGSAVFQYDAKGNLTVRTHTISGFDFVTQHDYDANNNLKQDILPSGRIVDYQRDVMGQITGITTTFDGETRSVIADIAHEPFGPVKAALLGNGISTTAGYDSGYRPELLDHGQIMSRQYYYSSRGNIEAIQNLLDAEISQTFDYDEMSRLDYAQGGYGELGYDYDLIGNRLTQTLDGSTTTNDFVAGTHRIATGNGNTYTYDGAGNAKSRNGVALYYNDANRLRQVGVNGSVKYLAQYNGFGQRVLKTDDEGQQLVFQYDEAGKLLGEYRSDGTVVREYIYGDDQLVSMISTEKPANYTPQAVQISNSSGNGAPSNFWQDSSGALVSGTAPASSGSEFDPTQDPDWFLAATGDFDGNGEPDMWWRNQVNGDLGVSLSSGNTANFYTAGNVPLDWDIEGAGDFNGDGKSDLFWKQNPVGQTAVWLMNGQYIGGGGSVAGVYDPNWEVADIADMNNDGISEVIWRNFESGKNLIWHLNGSEIIDYPTINYVADPDWHIVGAADINGDGNSDLIWYHAANHLVWAYQMDDHNVTANAGLGYLSGPSELLATGDFNGDGYEDLVWDNNGTQTIWYMGGLQISSISSVSDFDTALLQRHYYFHLDHLGAPQVLTDSLGEVVWKGQYEPFGEVDEVVAHITQPLRFPGQYLDREIGLHYNYFRDYDPEMGRYVQSDPIGLRGGPSTYAYVLNDPLSGIDPLGLQGFFDPTGGQYANMVTPPGPGGTLENWGNDCSGACQQLGTYIETMLAGSALIGTGVATDAALLSLTPQAIRAGCAAGLLGAAFCTGNLDDLGQIADDLIRQEIRRRRCEIDSQRSPIH